jgi:hypothetical protein
MSRYQQDRRRDAALDVATQVEADAIVAMLAQAGIRATTFSTGLAATNATMDWAAGVKVIVAPGDREAALDLLEAAAAEAPDPAGAPDPD